MDLDEPPSDFSIPLLEVQGTNRAAGAIVLDTGVPGVTVTLIPVN